MNKDEFDFVALRDLRIGLYVDLDLGWMAHPFPSSRFKIDSEKQMEVLRSLGVERIRFVPSKSDPVTPFEAASLADGATSVAQQMAAELAQKAQLVQQQRQQRAELRATQQQSLALCEQRFSQTAQQYRKALDLLPAKPQEAFAQCQNMVQGLVADMTHQGEAAIRLLTEAAGDKAALHPVNVTVISMLLARAMGLTGADMEALGLAAFLHDIGKSELPERVRKLDENFSGPELKAYQSHVEQSLQTAKKMGVGPLALQAIAQHHELADGSGFPHKLKLDALSKGARILALVNRYDGLCNPAKPSAALTPHEALAQIFAQQKTRFDATTLSAFIRMMGVYPPGSVVQLNDERHALVVSVNTARPLKPRVIVHEPGVPRHEAVVMDLEFAVNASIRRSLKPSSLPSAALDYLQPRPRMHYFFETAPESGPSI
jgi:putative nucleotidyltransferase with HDIG domain